MDALSRINASPQLNAPSNTFNPPVINAPPPLNITPKYLEIDKIVHTLISPYGHLYNKDTSLLRTVRLVPEMPKLIHSLPL